MQVTETLSDGLKREFRVVVPANDLDSKVSTRLDELKGTVRINGFRPGKVPVGHLKRMYGRSVMAEAIEATVRDANAQIVTERGFRLAMEPQVKLPTEEAAINAVFDGKSDLDYSVTMEVLPKIELSDFKDIKIERLTAEVADSEIDEAIGRIVDQNRPARAPKPPMATRSRFRSRERSTACRSRAVPARTFRWSSVRSPSSRDSKSSLSASRSARRAPSRRRSRRTI
jgi:trigger factor